MTKKNNNKTTKKWKEHELEQGRFWRRDLQNKIEKRQERNIAQGKDEDKKRVREKMKRLKGKKTEGEEEEKKKKTEDDEKHRKPQKKHLQKRVLGDKDQNPVKLQKFRLFSSPANKNTKKTKPKD